MTGITSSWSIKSTMPIVNRRVPPRSVPMVASPRPSVADIRPFNSPPWLTRALIASPHQAQPENIRSWRI